MTINNNNQLFDQARNETISYHRLYYSRHQLFEENSWLAKPDAGLMMLLEKELLPWAEKEQMTPAGATARVSAPARATPLAILDLGCGVGRNAVPMAIALAQAGVPAKIIGIDVLAESIDLLSQNSTKYGVEHIIEGLVADNDQFVIEPESYDLVAAISVVEHCAGRAKVLKLLKSIARGLKTGGLVKIEMTTGRKVIDLGTKQAVPTHVETKLSERQVKAMLNDAFEGFETLALEVFNYKEVLSQDDKKILWQSKHVSFSARAKHAH